MANQIKVKLIRNILLKGKHTPKGKVITVDETLGRELIQINKAVPAGAAEAEEPEEAAAEETEKKVSKK